MNEFNKLYDSIHMPEALKRKILMPAPVCRPKFRLAPVIAALMAVVLMLGLSPTVRAAVEDWIVVTFSGLDLTIYEKPMKEGDGTGQIIHVDTESETFAHLENGRLLFTGNGENLDVTDQITEETPFYYTYTDRDYEIILVVGYEGSIENFGVYEFIKENDAWITGTGRNFRSLEKDDQVYPWVKIVWNTLEIPWELPGMESVE